MTTCPVCSHEFRTSDRQTLFEAEENARLRAELVDQAARLGAYIAQIENESAEAVSALRAICRVAASEGVGVESIWEAADLVLALHDEETRIVWGPITPVDKPI